MPRIELTKKTIYLLSGIAALILALAVFLYLPLAASLRRSALAWEELHNELTLANANLRIYRESGLNKRFILQEDLPSAIESIASEGKALSLDFKSIARKEIRYTAEGYPVIPLEMEIEAEFEKLGEFLGKLEGIKDPIVTIDNLNLRREEKILPKVQASLVLNIHLAKD